MGYIKWFGHSAFEILLDGYRVLVDPWISNPKSPISVSEYKEHVDLIIVTHDHGDHTGDVVELMKRNKDARLVAVYELANSLAEKIGDSSRAIGANIGGPVKIEGVGLKVMFFPATHSATFGGTPTSVLLQGKEASIYHAGDTGLTAEMQLIGELYTVDIALLPIGGHFTMDSYQAAKAAQLLRAKVAIPMHYDTFPVIQADPNEFAEYVKKMSPETKVVILRPGEKFEF